MADTEPQLNSDLVVQTLNYHGQLLQKTWESEKGEELQKLGVGNLEYSVYQQRQKYLSFQDRGKRLKLQQFIVKKSNVLFDTNLFEMEETRSRSADAGHFALLPPFEYFLSLDKTSRLQHLFQSLKIGDIIIANITSKANAGLILKVLCVEGENVHSVGDLNIKAFCPTSNLISAVDKKNLSRSFLMNDLVCCEVLEVVPDAEKIICGMKGVYTSIHRARLGLFHSDDFPEPYKLAQEPKTDHFEGMLEKSVGFHNPSNINCLSNSLGLGLTNHTNMVALKGRFPETEFATELRQVQAAKWAFRSVADGIDHFKAGRHTEAFQCLNKALTIDTCNIEGLVARGALYANSGNFKKAIEDFESALKVNPNHQNARKYLGETLVAYGRSFEEENKMDEALKAYEGCLAIIPYHEEAQNSIEFIKSKHMNGSIKIEAEGILPGLTPSKAQGVKDTLKQLLGNDEVIKDEGNAKKKKKEKKPRRKKHRSSSSSSSSSSGSSSSSSSTSTSDATSDSSHDSPHKKKHKRKSETKDRSLSPLSKRMAMMDSTIVTEGSTNQRGSHYNPPAVPYTFSSAALPSYPTASSTIVKTDKESEYEQRVCKFLEQTKGDSDYEEKVRKFLDETAKWKKEKKAMEEKAKKKRKKEKKAKSKNKKKKHEDKQKRKMLKELEEKKLREALRREKHRRRSNNVDEEEEFLYGDKPDLSKFLTMGSLPDLEDLQSKLSAYYAKVEKGPTPKKKEKSSSIEKSASSSKNKSGSPKVHYIRDDDKEEQARLRKLEKKKLDMFAESPPRSDKLPSMPSSAPPVLSTKFKMQIGGNSTRVKKREKQEVQKETWDDVGEKRFIYVNETGNEGGGGSTSKDVISEVKKTSEKKKENIGDSLAKVPTVMDKLGGFRINTMVADKKRPISPSPASSKRKIRARAGSGSSSSSSPVGRIVIKKRDKSPEARHSRSRSHSRPRKKYSSGSPAPPRKYSSDSRGSSYRKNRSRSKSGSYRSRSGRRYRSSESGSYRSRSYSRSRSRSNSMDYRRRSRSRSDDRHNYRNKYQGRYPRNRGTYYRPRFQNYKNPRGGNGNYIRGHRMGGRYIPRGRGGYIPRMRRGRARYFNNYRPRERDYRRYDRDMSRSDDDMDSPMRKVDLAKERIDKLLSEDKRHTGPLSEGEERDDDYIERKEYEGKWSKDVTPSDVKSDKKEDSKDRKSYSKPNPW